MTPRIISAPERRRGDRPLHELFELIPGYDPFAVEDPTLYFDEESGWLAIGFIEDCLTHVKGKLRGKRLRLELWQWAAIGCLFGWKREDGLRRYTDAFLYIPRKNGKSVLAAAIGNYILFMDNEPGAEIYCAAADREQAGIVFAMAKDQILRNKTLARHAGVYRNSILLRKDNSFLKAISADAETKHGYNAHALLIDELHAQPDRELVDVLVTSTGSREEPITIYITTADYIRPSICNEKLEYARAVRDGEHKDDTFLPVVFEATREDDWKEEETWKKANPNLGVSKTYRYMRQQFNRAIKNPAYENTFRRLDLNQQTEQAERMIQMHLWDECNLEPVFEGPCYGALDLSSTKDLTAFILFFPETYSVLAKFWVPEERAEEREKEDRVPYLTWIRQGLIEKTEGDMIDYRLVQERIVGFCDEYDVQDVAFDPWQAGDQAQTLERDHGIEMVKFPQTHANFTEPTNRLLVLIGKRELRHGGNACLRWQAGNAMAEHRGENLVKISKKKSGDKVDGMVALTMGIGRWLANDDDPGESVYNEREPEIY